MGTIPVLMPQEVVRALRNLGFAEVRQRGSHKQFRHPDGRVTTVPLHKGRDISPSLLRKITAEDCCGHRFDYRGAPSASLKAAAAGWHCWLAQQWTVS